jgi:pyruvate formate lyase activating enzyme
MGRRVEPEELFKEIVVDRPFWDRSGGGVTLSGGEPLAQPEFSRSFLDVCRRTWVHTAIETSGYAPQEHLRHVATGAALVIYDLKAVDDELHHRLTGRRNRLVKDNLLFLLQTGIEVLVRVPLVPGCNDSTADLEALGAFLEDARPGISVEPLAYHRLGEAKYPRLGRKYALEGMATPGEDFLARARRVLEAYRVTVITD